MSQLKTKLTTIKADYDDSCEICDEILGLTNNEENNDTETTPVHGPIH